MKIRNYLLKLRLRTKKFIIDLKKTHLKDLRNVLFSKIKKIPGIIHLKNLVLFGSIISILILVLFIQRFDVLRDYFIVKQPVVGGVYRHGVVGEVDKINPLFIQNEAEESAVKMIFSGLTREINGQPVPDLADRWETPDATTYIFYLKENIYWHDGTKLTVDDVIFTLSLIQNPDTRTPLGTIWRGVNYEKISENALKVTLPNPYPGFLKVCSEPILPAHILGQVDPQNIKVAEYNSKPVGSGPYVFDRFDQAGNNSEVVLKRNDQYYLPQKPYIKEVRVVFFETESEMISAVSRRQIDGVNSVGSESDLAKAAVSDDKKIFLPSYKVLLFNYKNTFLSEKDNRVAISRVINRDEILNLLGQKENAIYGPLLPGTPGFNSKTRGHALDLAAASGQLQKLGWQKNVDGIYSKDNKPLELRLAYIDSEENLKIAENLYSQFYQAGIKLVSSGYDSVDFNQNVMRPRNFDIMILDQNIGLDSDLYPFWHSTQISDPGQNLSGFSDRKTDKLLEQARKSADRAYIAERNSQVESSILDSAAAYFLYRDTAKTAFAKSVFVEMQTRLSRPINILNNIDSWFMNYKEVSK